jgi:hypothetical protein
MTVDDVVLVPSSDNKTYSLISECKIYLSWNCMSHLINTISNFQYTHTHNTNFKCFSVPDDIDEPEILVRPVLQAQ